jgi:hypothetical protein
VGYLRRIQQYWNAALALVLDFCFFCFFVLFFLLFQKKRRKKNEISLKKSCRSFVDLMQSFLRASLTVFLLLLFSVCTALNVPHHHHHLKCAEPECPSFHVEQSTSLLIQADEVGTLELALTKISPPAKFEFSLVLSSAAHPESIVLTDGRGDSLWCERKANAINCRLTEALVEVRLSVDFRLSSDFFDQEGAGTLFSVFAIEKCPQLTHVKHSGLRRGFDSSCSDRRRQECFDQGLSFRELCALDPACCSSASPAAICVVNRAVVVVNANTTTSNIRFEEGGQISFDDQGAPVQFLFRSRSIYGDEGRMQASNLLSNPQSTVQIQVYGDSNGNAFCTGPTTTVDDIGDDASEYVGVQSFSDLECILESMVLDKRVNRWHKTFARGAWEFAEQLQIWLNKVVGTDASSEYKLKFGYYPNAGEVVDACEVRSSGPYVTGGGNPLCQLVERVAGLREKSLATLITSLLDFGLPIDSNGGNNTDKYLNSATILAHLSDLGFRHYKDFIHSWNTNFVYNPEVDRYGEQLRYRVHEMPPGYHGMSGGGGSGTGFEIFCVDNESGAETTIVTGGGGGGGGMSSPEAGTTVQAGGGGGGGVQLGPDGLPRIGAGIGNHPYDFLQIRPDVDVPAFLEGMRDAISDLRACHASNTSHLSLRGGGGGGGGAETFLRPPTNVTDAPQERARRIANIGWGFQFAVGNNVKLTPNAGNNELPLVVCPYGIDTVDLKSSCVDTISDAKRTEANTYVATNAIFTCASTIATRMCALANYTVDGVTTVYGAYLNYDQCNCEIAKQIYQQQVIFFV